jgi:hypothetical protein
MSSGDYPFDLASGDDELGMEVEGGAADADEVMGLGAVEGAAEGDIVVAAGDGGSEEGAAAAVAVPRGPSPRSPAALDLSSDERDGEGDAGMGPGEYAGIGTMTDFGGLDVEEFNAAVAAGVLAGGQGDEGMVSENESAGSVPEDQIDPAIDALTAELLSLGEHKGPFTPSPAAKTSRTPHTTPVSISKPAPGGLSPELGYAAGQGSASRHAAGSPAAACALGSCSVSSTPSPVGHSSKAGRAGPACPPVAGDGIASPGHTPFPSKVSKETL